MQIHTLSELSFAFLRTNPELSVKLLKDNMALHPEDGTAYYLMGLVSLEKKDYYTACDFFEKAIELNFPDLDLDYSIELITRRCKTAMLDVGTWKLFSASRKGKKSVTVPAENNHAMGGVRTGLPGITDSSKCITSLDKEPV